MTTFRAMATAAGVCVIVAGPVGGQVLVTTDVDFERMGARPLAELPEAYSISIARDIQIPRLRSQYECTRAGAIEFHDGRLTAVFGMAGGPSRFGNCSRAEFVVL